MANIGKSLILPQQLARLLHGFLGVALFRLTHFLSITLVSVGILRLPETYPIILAPALCSNLVNVHLESALGMGAIVLRTAVGLVFSVIEIGKCLFGRVVYYLRQLSVLL